MRALLPEPADDIDVHDWYAREWIDQSLLRVDFVSSADGAATAGGKSEGLQTPGDNRVFAAMRDVSDVVLVGAGTARTEGYQAIQLSERRRGLRRGYGLPESLPIAVVTQSLALDPDTELFTGASDDARTIVITCGAADGDRRSALERVADVIVAGDDVVDFAVARAELEQRGLHRILCEGGPSLFASLAGAGVVDELCLSVTPYLAGPGSRRIMTGEMWRAPPVAMQLVHVLEEDGALFCRYRLTR